MHRSAVLCTLGLLHVARGGLDSMYPTINLEEIPIVSSCNDVQSEYCECEGDGLFYCRNLKGSFQGANCCSDATLSVTSDMMDPTIPAQLSTSLWTTTPVPPNGSWAYIFYNSNAVLQPIMNVPEKGVTWSAKSVLRDFANLKNEASVIGVEYATTLPQFLLDNSVMALPYASFNGQYAEMGLPAGDYIVPDWVRGTFAGKTPNSQYNDIGMVAMTMAGFMLTMTDRGPHGKPHIVCTMDNPKFMQTWRANMYVEDIVFMKNTRVDWRAGPATLNMSQWASANLTNDFTFMKLRKDTSSAGTVFMKTDFVTVSDIFNFNTGVSGGGEYVTSPADPNVPGDMQPMVIVECYDLTCTDVDTIVVFGTLKVQLGDVPMLEEYIDISLSTRNGTGQGFSHFEQYTVQHGMDDFRLVGGLVANEKLPAHVQERVTAALLRASTRAKADVLSTETMKVPAPSLPPMPPAQPDVGWTQIGNGFCRKLVPDTVFAGGGTMIATFTGVEETGNFETEDQALRFCLLRSAACCSVILVGDNRRVIAYGTGSEGAVTIVNNTLGGESAAYKTFVPSILPPSPPTAVASPPPPMPVLPACESGVRVKMWVMVSNYAEEASIKLTDDAEALLFDSGAVFADTVPSMVSTCITQPNVFLTALDSYGDGWGNTSPDQAHVLVVVVGDKYKTVILCNPNGSCDTPFLNGEKFGPVELTVGDTSAWSPIATFPLMVPYP